MDGGAALLSWSGSMFEYLMPALVMRAPLGCSARRNEPSGRAPADRIRGGTRGCRGASLNRHTTRETWSSRISTRASAFPVSGLKRGLGDDAVVAPYATALAAMIAPHAAVRNFARLAGAGGRGRYGWYEALDYTPARLPEGETVAIVRAYMAHHQGMTVVALANALHHGLMPARFHAEPIVQATELLLQERAPREVDAAHSRRESDEGRLRSRARPADAAALLLAAPAHSAHPAAVQRPLRRDDDRGRVGIQPLGRSRRHALARGRDARRLGHLHLPSRCGQRCGVVGGVPTDRRSNRIATKRRSSRIGSRSSGVDGSITTTLEVAISPEDDAEVRRVTIANGGSRTREIELTSYAEIVLAPDAADAAHPAFSKLFVQTDTGRQPRERAQASARTPRRSARTFIDDSGAILATRRRRSPDEPEVWAAHLAVSGG